MVRYYPVTTAAPYTPDTFKGAWDDTASALTRKLATAKVVGQTSHPVSETSTSNTWDACVLRLVSDALTAGTIEGDVDLCFGCRDGGTTMKASYYVHLWVTQGDTDAVRAVLVEDYVEPDTAEWTGSAGMVGQRLLAPLPVGPATVQAGDRLVLEVGYRANNTTATSQTGRLYYNGNGADMVNGDTGGSVAAWVDVPVPVPIVLAGLPTLGPGPALAAARRWSPRLVASDLGNAQGEDLSLDVAGGRVEWDANRRGPKLTCTLVARVTDLVPAYRGLAALWVDLADLATGEAESWQVGLFAFKKPAVQQTRTGLVATYQGFDPTWFLATSALDEPFAVASGANLIAATQAALTAAGLRHAVPPSSAVAPRALDWPTKLSELDIYNEVLQAAAYMNLYPSRDGTLLSRPYRRLEDEQPAVVYRPGTGDLILAPFSLETADDRLCNFVEVVCNDPARAEFSATAENLDPASPASNTTTGIGRRIARYVEDPHLASVTEAQAMANRVIEEGAAVYEKATLVTRKDPRRAAQEVYEIVGLGDAYDGRWWCDGWTMDLSTGGTMVHRLNRVVPFAF